MHSTIFDYLQPTDTQKCSMNNLRSAYRALQIALESSVPDGRYKALAMTSLEESAMWSMKGITRQSDGTPRPDDARTECLDSPLPS